MGDISRAINVIQSIGPDGVLTVNHLVQAFAEARADERKAVERKWLVRCSADCGGDYVLAFVMTHTVPTSVEWTSSQSLAHRFADRNEASRLACNYAGARVIRLAPPKRSAPR